MRKFLVTKYYGHYICVYEVHEETEKTALINAERYGALLFSRVLPYFYGEGGYAHEVTEVDKYDKQLAYLEEAIELGMPASAQQHEMVFGLPFVTVLNSMAQKQVTH